MSDMRHLIESMDKISEAAPGAAGPIDTAAQNVQSNWATIKQIPSNLKRLATDPVQYIKDLPAPSPDQIMTGWAGGGLRSGGLLKGISATGAASTKSPMASMAQQLTQPSSTGGKITTLPTGIKHTADLPVLTRQAEPAAPAVWRNPRTGETSATAPGAKQTTTAGPKETTPADLQKLANVPTSRTNPVNPSAKPLIQRLPGETPAQAIARIQAATTKPMDEEKIVPGTKFPGYWQGRDSAAKSRDRMVGDESIIKELHNTTTSAEFKLQEQYDQFKKDFGAISPPIANMSKAEVNKQIGSVGPSIANLPKAEVDKQISSKAQNPAYTGIDPIVRQRMGMQPATQGEIQSYIDKNPPVLKTSDGSAVTSGSGASIRSGGQVDVAKAADLASPDRSASVARQPAPAQPVVTPAPAPAPVAVTPAQPTPAAPAPAASIPAATAVVSNPVKPATASTSAPLTPAAAPVKPAATAAAAPYKGNQGAREIQAANPSIKDVNKIQPGQRLKLPDSDEDYVVQRGDTLDKIGKMFRGGEIGGRVVGGDGPAPTPATRPQTAAPANTAALASTATPVSSPQPLATKAAPAVSAQPTPQSAASIKAEPVKTSANPTVKLGFGDPGYTPIIGNKLEKRSDGNWYYPGNNRARRPDVIKYAETQLARQATPGGTATKPSAGTASSNRTAPVTGRSSFADLVGNAETGNKNIPNQTGSSAAGVYGFMPDAFNGFVSVAKPGDPLYGKTWNDYLTDVNVQRATMAAQEKDINNQLVKNNIDPNVGNKYLMHFLGGPTAVPVMKALEKDPKTPLSTWFGRDPYPDVAIADTPSAFSKFKQSNPGHPISKLDYNQYRSSRPAVYRQNPQLSRENIRTVGDISNWSNRKMSQAAAQKNEAVDKLAEQFAAFMEAQDQYGPEYQAMVQRVGQRAKQGPLKTVWDPVKRVYKNVPVKQEKQVKEFENAQDQDSQVTSPPSPAATAASQTFVQDKELQNMNAQKTLEADAGAQDPNKQTTSPPSPAAVAKPVAPSAPDVSVATAKTTMAGLKPALGPGVDTNAAATGVTKANLGQQLNPAEQQAVSAITPLVMKAATIPSAAPQLRSALTNAGTMARAAAAKQGKM